MTPVYHVQQLPLFPLPPEKKCTGPCQQWHPATLEFFYKSDHGKYGVQATCKECCKKITKLTKKAQWEDTITLVCDTCGKEFQRQKVRHEYDLRHFDRKHVYCSRPCGRGTSKNLPDSIGEEYLQGATLQDLAITHNVTIGCVRDQLDRLGVPRRKQARRLKPFYPKPKHPPTHAPHTEEAKQKIRQAHITRIVEGKNAPISKLETRVGEELTRLGFTFIPQWGMYAPNGKAIVCVDFMLDDGRAIEVNGTFWHADPRKYPDGPITESQRRKLISDKRKRTILERNNIPLIILWEMDLTADFTGTISKALSSQ